jgi:hypothetical protein
MDSILRSLFPMMGWDLLYQEWTLAPYCGKHLNRGVTYDGEGRIAFRLDCRWILLLAVFVAVPTLPFPCPHPITVDGHNKALQLTP